MQNTHSETPSESTTPTEPLGLSSKFGDLDALLAHDMAVPVSGGRPAEIDPNAEPVAPISMSDLKPDPASTEARVALEFKAAQTVLDAVNTETLETIANGGAAAVAPQLKDNPSLLAWMQERAGQLLKATDSAREAGGQVLYFTLTRLPESGRSQYFRRNHAEPTERSSEYGRHHVQPGRKSFLEMRQGVSASRGDYRSTSTR